MEEHLPRQEQPFQQPQHPENQTRKNTHIRLGVFAYGILLMAGLIMLLAGFFVRSAQYTDATLYYANFDFTALVPVTRSVRMPAGAESQVEALVQQLIFGPQTNESLPSLPARLRLLSSWVAGDTAYVNFDRTIMFNLADDADAEIMAVYSIVHTLVDNISGIGQVHILVECVPLRTLRGITRIQYPLSPRKDLIGRYSYRERSR